VRRLRRRASPAVAAREGLLASGRTEHKAILLSSVSFAVIHGFFLVDKIIVTILFGAIAGLYYVRERNLPVLLATHVALDVITFSPPSTSPEPAPFYGSDQPF
jgi:membrane protease YdiL (CAAX protease family)